MRPRRHRYALILAFVSCFLLHPPGVSAGEQATRDTRIVIDLSRSAGPLPYLFRGGVFNGNVIPRGYMLQKYLDDIKPGAFEFYLAHTTIRPSRNLQDLERRLKEWDGVAREITKRGGEIVVAIDAMPAWLTSNRSRKPVNPAIGDMTPVGNLSPPKDYDTWATLVETVVRHFARQGIKARYTVWGEPDIVWWQGTTEEYCKLYRYSVIGAKRADRNAKIGGPGVSVWNGRKDGEREPLIRTWIRYASRTPLPELGLDKLPIDYVNWHQFNANPLDPLSYAEPARTIRAWLKESGYSDRTELHIGEWIIWQYFGKEHGFSNPEHDSEINASYIASSLIAMDEAGIQRQSYAYLIDSVPGKEFVGDFGLLTKRGVTKASFNAFKAVSMLEGKRLTVENRHPTVRMIGTNDQGRISLLLSNFIPYGKMLMQTAVHALQEKGYTKDDMKRYHLEPRQLKEIVNGHGSVDGLKLPPKVKNDIREALNKVHGGRPNTKDPASLRITFANDPAKKYRFEKYLIDASHSNAAAAQQSIARLGLRSVRAVNDAVGVKLQKVEDRAIAGPGSLGSIRVDPYAVMLMVFTPL